MKSLLNKLTLEMFDPISADILKIANQSKWETQGETLKVVIEEVFHKACDEPHWSSMYAQLCGKLVKDLDPEIKDEENEGKTGPKLSYSSLLPDVMRSSRRAGPINYLQRKSCTIRA